MKNPTFFQALLSIMILFSVVNATAQNSQHTKKKYSITKGSNRVTKEAAPPLNTLQVSRNQYTDAELIKLANYIKKLEKQNTLTGELIAAQEASQSENTTSDKNAFDKHFTDDELIKMANYIKFLEITDWTHTVAVAK